MKKVTAAEIKEIDRRAIEEFGIPGLTLMENAGSGIADFIDQKLKVKRVLILCGKGNNGGDGFVIARHLIEKQYLVSTFLVGSPEELTPDSKVNFEKLKAMDALIHFIEDEADFLELKSSLSEYELVVDALFGVGLSRSLDEFYQSLVSLINDSRAPVLAVDIASGLNADTGEMMGAAIQARMTTTLGLPKVGLEAGEGPKLSGAIVVVDIGLPHSLLS